jgi:NADPH:quinone reductase-like Zn-dependent oxidoreductase
MATSGRELRSTAHDDGTLELTIADVVHDDPAPGEILVRIEAAPINPSDLGLRRGRGRLSIDPRSIASLTVGVMSTTSRLRRFLRVDRSDHADRSENLSRAYRED